MKPNFRGKKVLVMGLGLLGGGLATTKWLLKHGAKVTVTDLKSREVLKPTIKSLGPLVRKIKLVLGKHQEDNFKINDIVVVNPAVPRESKYLTIARRAGARIENDASLFFKFCKNPVVAVTGTRGKTTTVNWIYHLLRKKYPRTVLAGNSSDVSLLRALDRLDGKTPVVVELSSWQLELLPQAWKSRPEGAPSGPHIAVITNIFRDHLNRYPSMKSYALAKANIFLDQAQNDFVLLNKNNLWTKFFQELKPRSRIVYFPVPIGLNPEKFKRVYGLHNFYNLNVAIIVARHFGVSGQEIKKALKTLPQIKFRQETILKRKNFEIINDTTATTPEATIAALERFSRPPAGGEKLILIAGGTDKKLDFSEWAKIVKKYVRPENLYLLNGSATKKMVRVLQRIGYFKNSKPQLFEELAEIIKRIKNHELRIRQRNGRKEAVIPNSIFVILFSPGAASFEKFKNEFDRGRCYKSAVAALL